MTQEAIKAAEKRGYSKGYAAGKRKQAIERSAAAERRAERRFWQQVFCAALTGTLQNNGWKTGDKRWNDCPSYVDGCSEFADIAVRRRKGMCA